VSFIDPRRSEVDIVQAVGRAIRLALDKTVGTIVIPVFIDTDEDPAIALDGSAFKPVWDVTRHNFCPRAPAGCLQAAEGVRPGTRGGSVEPGPGPLSQQLSQASCSSDVVPQ